MIENRPRKTDYSGARRRAKIRRNKLKRRRLRPAISTKLKKARY